MTWGMLATAPADAQGLGGLRPRALTVPQRVTHPLDKGPGRRVCLAYLSSSGRASRDLASGRNCRTARASRSIRTRLCLGSSQPAWCSDRRKMRLPPVVGTSHSPGMGSFDVAKPLRELSRRLRSIRRILRKTRQYEPIELFGNFELSLCRRRLRRSAGVMDEHADGRVGTEHELSREQPIRQASGRVDVGARVHLGTPERLLRRHESRRPLDDMVTRERHPQVRRLSEGLDQSEVQDFDEVHVLAVAAEEVPDSSSRWRIVCRSARRRKVGRRTRRHFACCKNSQSALPLEQHASAVQFCTTHVNSVRRRTIEHARARPFDHRPVAQCRAARHLRRRPDRRPDSCVRETVDAAHAIENGVHLSGDRTGEVAVGPCRRAATSCSASPAAAGARTRQSGSAKAASCRANRRQVGRAGLGTARARGAPAFERPIERPEIQRPPETGLFERTHGARTSQAAAAVTTGGFGSAAASARGAANGPGAVTTGGFSSGAPAPRGAANGLGEVQTAGFDLRASAPAQPSVAALTKPIDRPVEIVFKPTPEYTDEARGARIEGTVSLELEFAAGGDVRVLRVVRGLGHGLDEAARAGGTPHSFQARAVGRPARRFPRHGSHHVPLVLARGTYATCPSSLAARCSARARLCGVDRRCAGAMIRKFQRPRRQAARERSKPTTSSTG